MDDRTTFDVWEERYGSQRVWSGEPNRALVEHIDALPPGTALDLGCGEGADAIWLAENDWEVTGVDVSPTALSRGEAEARRRGLGIAWVQADLARWAPERTYDLVTSFFLHSPVDFPREQILLRAATAVHPGGILLIVGHAGFPPWSRHARTEDHHPPVFPTISQTLDEARVGDWEHLNVGLSPRTVDGPDGQRATIDDTVVMVRRPK